MAKHQARVVYTFPAELEKDTPFAVLYISASEQLDAIDVANEWAHEHGFERARELTLGVARKDGQDFYVARCYRLESEEIEGRRRLAQ